MLFFSYYKIFDIYSEEQIHLTLLEIKFSIVLDIFSFLTGNKIIMETEDF